MGTLVKNGFSQKGCKVNHHLKELCEEINVSLIDNTKRIELQHVNQGKLHLNKNGSKILPNNFIDGISNVFNWQSELDNPNAVPGEYICRKTLSAKEK